MKKRQTLTMTALEYMEKQFQKHCQDFLREIKRGAPRKDTDNILEKVRYYGCACEALRKVGDGNA